MAYWVVISPSPNTSTMLRCLTLRTALTYVMISRRYGHRVSMGCEAHQSCPT
jgi:hypothetical protein